MAGHGIPAILLKGTEFADRLYSEPGLRPFRDIDIMVSKKALADAGTALADLGYQAQAAPVMKYAGGYGQHSWRLTGGRGATVELHWNLVNSPGGLSI